MLDGFLRRDQRPGHGTSAPEQVIFHTVTVPKEQHFALEQLTQYFEDEDAAIWPIALKAGQIKLAEADLNDYGVTE